MTMPWEVSARLSTVGEQRDAGEAKDDGYGGSGAGAERGDDRG